MEKALIQFKLKNELLSSNSKTLSIFREETENTAFMGIKVNLSRLKALFCLITILNVSRIEFK